MDVHPHAAVPDTGRRYGPGWPVRPAGAGADPEAVFPGVLWSRGARNWYLGACFSLLWMLTVGGSLAEANGSALWMALGVAMLALFSAAFLIAAPIAWALPFRGRLAVCGSFFLLSFALAPWFGWDVCGTWVYVGVTVGMCVFPWRVTWLLIAGLSALALVFRLLDDGRWSDGALALPAVVLSVSMMMASFGRTLATINELRATQNEMALLAAERERGRVARDIHDILGHSLTVITVKAELAGRLVHSDPNRAQAEIGEVEALARGALADVRATVSGFRGVNVSGELAGARVALEAAGIIADLPGSAETIAPEHREMAGWVVREGVTNVVRHSAASRCRVRLDAHEIEIADDGVGPGPGGATSTGLAGLGERVEAAGGRMTVGRSDLGGFRLRVQV